MVQPDSPQIWAKMNYATITLREHDLWPLNLHEVHLSYVKAFGGKFCGFIWKSLITFVSGLSDLHTDGLQMSYNSFLIYG